MSANSNTGYNYGSPRDPTTAKNLSAAIEMTVLNYFHDQLGLSEEFCRERTLAEEQRTIPKAVLAGLVALGWSFQDERVLDVGAGQGGLVLELLEYGADAYGVEPGNEFANLARMRLKEAGHDPARVHVQTGESLPFGDNYFDYVISLQVLEHVKDPEPVLREILRVLRPGAQCHLRCENYLSFREPHYRVRWLPLLPKRLGAFYLRVIGRDPNFLTNYVYYTTYPQIWRICSRVGFMNLTYDHLLRKLREPRRIRTRYQRIAAGTLGLLPDGVSRRLLLQATHLKNCLKPIVTLILQKPL